MKNNLLKWAMIVAVVIALLSLLVGAFDGLATPVANTLGKPVEAVKSMFRQIAAISIAVLLMLAGVMTIAGAPILGVGLLLVGAVTILTTLGVFGGSGSED